MGKQGKNTQRKRATKEAVRSISTKLDLLLAKAKEEMKDVDIFAKTAPKEPCLICFCPLPTDSADSAYKACCGQKICGGCVYGSNVATVKMNQVKKSRNQPPLDFTCAFCREPDTSSNKVVVSRIQKRMDLGDAEAFRNMATFYREGSHGVPKDGAKSLECFHRAAELGMSMAFNDIAFFYENGISVDRNDVKVKSWLTIAAKMGNEYAHANLGEYYEKKGNIDLAIKHWHIAAQSGDQDSLDVLKKQYQKGKVGKEEFLETLEACHSEQVEIKSEGRDAYAKVFKKQRCN